jgi:DNA-directed RNA polymerase specialized sigma24 family protein
MNEDKLQGSILVYVKGSRDIREAIFRSDLLPILEDIINGVFLTLKIRYLIREDQEDIKQEIYLKLLTRIQEKPPQNLKGIRSIKNYFFIAAKNIAIDCLRTRSRLKEFDQEIIECLTLYKIDEKI